MPKNIIIIIFGIIFDLSSLVVNLYLPIKRIRRIPNKRENEIFDLNYRKALILATLSPKRCFIEYLKISRMLSKFNIKRIENGVGMWISVSGLFSWTGISFKLSKKILENAKSFITEKSVKEVLFYDLFDLVYNVFKGSWSNIKKYDENLLDLNLRIGESWHVSTYMMFHGLVKIEQGAFQDTKIIINKLFEIWETYENENAEEYMLMLKTILLLKSAKLNEALTQANAGIDFQAKTGREFQKIWCLGFKAIIQIYLNDMESAGQSLYQAKELAKRQLIVPHTYRSSYLIAHFLFDLYSLERAILLNDKSESSKKGKKAYLSGKRALKISCKNALIRTESLRLMGLHSWLVGRQSRAIRWWNESIKEGERLGAHVELVKTYTEIARRLLEKRSRFEELNGIRAEKYLEKAKKLSEKKNLYLEVFYNR